jgi:hypothetical protein
MALSLSLFSNLVSVAHRIDGYNDEIGLVYDQSLYCIFITVEPCVAWKDATFPFVPVSLVLPLRILMYDMRDRKRIN